jgi:hypothetical protein
VFFAAKSRRQKMITSRGQNEKRGSTFFAIVIA